MGLEQTIKFSRRIDSELVEAENKRAQHAVYGLLHCIAKVEEEIKGYMVVYIHKMVENRRA
jgi:hypothetical protein